jgi:hypothetical protein
MGRAIECVSGYASNPGSTLTTLLPSTGQSFTIRGTDTTKGTWLLNAWAFCATVGELRITSPRLHDQVQGIRNRVIAAGVYPLVAGPNNDGFTQRLYAQDGLTAQITGGSSEIDLACLLIGYDDLAGVSGRFIDQPTLLKNGLNVVTAEVSISAVTTGLWGGGTAINSSYDNLIANTDYAILGGMTDTRGCGVGITGVDFGNLRVGFPCEPSLRFMTQNWFQELATAFSTAYIPVFNSANKTQTIIDLCTNQAGGSYIVNLQLVQLAPGSVPVAATGAATAAASQPA